MAADFGRLFLVEIKALKKKDKVGAGMRSA
jgi:hypothetical protein